MKLTPFEKSWLRILGVLTFVIIGILMVRPLLPGSHIPFEPLADTASLQKLMAGLPLSRPAEESRAEFHGKTAVPPKLTSLTVIQRVLGTSSPDEKHIEVDLTNQRVYAYQGNTQIFNFLVSTGKWYPTPTGEFRIWVKVRSQRMEGGNKAIGTYYYLPNVPYVMFFYNDVIPKISGFSFHGTYWHNNFGHPMSHGCVNMRTEDAKLLYDWADPPVTNPRAWSTLATDSSPGTKVVIYGQTPNE